jgi:hypothetical protein
MDCPDGKTIAYPLSLRHIEEMMRDRGVFVDHATVHRWAIKMLPVLAAEPEGRLAQALADWFPGHADYLDSALALAPKGAKTY